MFNIKGTPRDVQIIQETVRKVKRTNYKPQQRRRSVSVASSTGRIITAKTQEAWQTDGTVSVKKLDSDGNETGDAFDVYIFVDKSATDPTSGYGPEIADEQEIEIMKDKEGDWILVRPDVKESAQIGIILSAQTQEAWQTDGTVSCKLMNSSGVESGDAFDVYIHANKASTNPTSGYWPTVSNDQEVLIMKDAEGDWILVRPDVQESESCT